MAGRLQSLQSIFQLKYSKFIQCNLYPNQECQSLYPSLSFHALSSAYFHALVCAASSACLNPLFCSLAALNVSFCVCLFCASNFCASAPFGADCIFAARSWNLKKRVRISSILNGISSTLLCFRSLDSPLQREQLRRVDRQLTARHNHSLMCVQELETLQQAWASAGAWAQELAWRKWAA